MDTPLTEVETQKESWEERFDTLYDDDLWFPLPTNEYGDVEEHHESEIKQNKKVIKAFIGTEISQALLSERARLVERIKNEVRMNAYSDADDVTLWNVAVDKAISIIKESR